jgi:hypothetical protein
LTDLRKILKYQISRKTHTDGADCLHADGDMTKLTVVFRGFAKAPRNRNPQRYAYLVHHYRLAYPLLQQAFLTETSITGIPLTGDSTEAAGLSAVNDI